jgi:hypothetical protein
MTTPTHQHRTVRRLGVAALLSLTVGLAACGDDDADMDDVDITTPGGVDATTPIGDLPDDSMTDTSMTDTSMTGSSISEMTTIAP